MYIVYRKEKFIYIILQFKTWMKSTTLECWTFWYNLLAKGEVSSLLFCLSSSFFQISPNWGLATMQSVWTSIPIYRSIDVEIHQSFSIKLAIFLNREQLISQLWTEKQLEINGKTVYNVFRCLIVLSAILTSQNLPLVFPFPRLIMSSVRCFNP